MERQIGFIKAQGLGNDFIIFDSTGTNGLNIAPETAKRLCDRHFGIGADGVVILTDTAGADVSMRIINSDGSVAEMCGNAARCVSRLMFEKKGMKELSIETSAGIKRASVRTDGGRFISSTVAIGSLRPAGRFDYVMDGTNAEFMRVDAGNPHAVTYSVFPDEADFMRHGRIISCHPLFSEGTNVEFAQCLDDRHIKIEVYERGAGATLACGTGAAAAVFAGYKAGLLRNEAECELSGGKLLVRIGGNDEVTITGDARIAYRGTADLESYI